MHLTYVGDIQLVHDLLIIGGCLSCNMWPTLYLGWCTQEHCLSRVYSQQVNVYLIEVFITL